jgi:2-C-methyl-D-erythritol 4-phosphate cytidylyltransferase
VAAGIEALPSGAALALVHDGARPCITVESIESTIAEARRTGAAVAGLPAWLTVKAVDAQDAVRLTLDRDRLWFAHTPQVGRREWFIEAIGRLRAASEAFAQFPDDAAMLEWAGFPVRMVPGDPWNLKVTTPDDVVLVEAILSARGAQSRSNGRKPKRVARVR